MEASFAKYDLNSTDATRIVNLEQYNQYIETMPWLTAEEAIARLGVRAQTLYAYVSRGRLEARPDPADPRRSLYDAEGVARLAARRAGPRRAAEVASGSMDWGEPVLASALSCVSHGRLFYRGRDAALLAERATLEEAAAWFWTTPAVAPKREDSLQINAGPRAPGSARARLFAALATRAASDPFARGRARAALAAEAGDLLNLMADSIAEPALPGPIHERLAATWGLTPAQGDLIRRTMVLLLDHELNASTFAARVSASTGGSLAAAALAGLSTLSGPLHGAAVEAVIAFVRDAERQGPSAAIRARLDEGRSIPGFGHPLYPAGDPRAVALLAGLGEGPMIATLRAEVERETGKAANIDFATAAIAVQLALPEDAPFAIFAVGRAVGWLGHAMEQIETDVLIRPRARYVGPPLDP
jgi:citrate synthase